MFLEKEDVSLYYEERGEGSPLILIHGVIVDAGLFSQAAGLLSSHFRVITFDRRGNSRSTLRGPEENRGFSMEKQAEDIRDLMDFLHIDRAYILGASAGAVIGQYFMQRFPERVRHLIMYEPAMLGYMVKDPAVRAWTEEMQEIIGKRRYNSAVLQFAKHIASFDERSPKKPGEQSLREAGNFAYALTCEFPGLLAYTPDLSFMRQNRDRITLAAGEKSGDTVYARCPRELAAELGKKALAWPGYHNLPFDLPEEFAMCVLGTLILAGTQGIAGSFSES